MIPIVSFVGSSKSGKTTLIERLIPVLSSQGIKIGTIKHHPHDFEIDIPGKDTHRHKKAGAKISIISSPKKIAIVKEVNKDLSALEIVDRFMDGMDLIILEGFKKEPIPKIEVYQVRPEGRPVCIEDPNLIAVVADMAYNAHVPVFHRDDIKGIASFIVSRFKLMG
ncbi:MAG: molybdopterin-guanine dinucleotide biosynthesis protein B [Syntrophorhabdaceae bacterium]|nr:molybdopterin-guanine dinucleotide biosynthesis protein B [Syntrophorhabdaceae bacterium]